MVSERESVKGRKGGGVRKWGESDESETTH